MSTLTATRSTASTTTSASLWKAGVAASLGAAVATTSVAAAASAAGVSFAAGGSGIPLLGFTELTVAFSLIGVALAAVLMRVARTPRRTFRRTTVALAILSVVPDATFGFDAVSAAVLKSLHATAALIVIPAVARRLAEAR